MSYKGSYEAMIGAHPESIAEMEALRSAACEWFDEHRKKIRSWKDAKRRAREARINARSVRVARIYEAEGSYTAEEWIAKCEEFNHRCAYCYQPAILTADHVMPLVLGGSNYISNIVPACQSCNSRKGKKIVQAGCYAR